MLYIVATPIGNLEDITFRALRVLREVDFILAEDTRVTKKLLDRYDIKTPMISYFQHSGLKKVDYIIELLKQGKNLALVTDAGTPGISDPGNRLIAAVGTRHGAFSLDKSSPTRTGHGLFLPIIPIPGPSAVIAALSISGLPTDKFLFLGFIPHKKGREKFIRQILASTYTVVFYESCHRIIKTLEQLCSLCRNAPGRVLVDNKTPEKRLVVCRELTKKFESIYRGNIEEVLNQVKNDPVKGEYVVVAG